MNKDAPDEPTANANDDALRNLERGVESCKQALLKLNEIWGLLNNGEPMPPPADKRKPS